MRAAPTRSSRAATYAVIAVAVIGCGEQSEGDSTDARTVEVTHQDKNAHVHDDSVIDVFADEKFVADTLAELVAETPLVVRAEVVAADKADFIQEDPEGGGLQFEMVTLRVDEVLSPGDAPVMAGSQIQMRQKQSDLGKDPVTNGLHRAQRGQTGYFFLRPSLIVDDAWSLLCTQGQYILAEDGQLEGAHRDDPVIDEVEAIPPAELERLVRSTLPG